MGRCDVCLRNEDEVDGLTCGDCISGVLGPDHHEVAELRAFARDLLKALGKKGQTAARLARARELDVLREPAARPGTRTARA